MSDQNAYPPDKVWKSFTDNWIPIAEKAQEPLLKFTIYYMIFNHLYSMTTPENKQWWKTKHQIAHFLLKVLPELDEPFDINTLSLKTLHEPIQVGHSDGRRDEFNCLSLEDMETVVGKGETRNPCWDVVDIFIKVNIVRNNLFHGWKRNDTRDRELIKESIIVLETLINRVLSLKHLPGIIDAAAIRKQCFFDNTGTRHENPRNPNRRNHRP